MGGLMMNRFSFNLLGNISAAGNRPRSPLPPFLTDGPRPTSSVRFLLLKYPPSPDHLNNVVGVFIAMDKSNLTEIDKAIKKFISSMGMKIKIEDTNYSNYKYFNHHKYGTIRDITYQVKVLNKKNELVYLVDVHWGVIGGQLKLYEMGSFSKSNPFSYLGFDDKLINQYLVEKTRGMAEEWIQIFPERR